MATEHRAPAWARRRKSCSRSSAASTRWTSCSRRRKRPPSGYALSGPRTNRPGSSSTGRDSNSPTDPKSSKVSWRLLFYQNANCRSINKSGRSTVEFGRGHSFTPRTSHPGPPRFAHRPGRDLRQAVCAPASIPRRTAQSHAEGQARGDVVLPAREQKVEGRPDRPQGVADL